MSGTDKVVFLESKQKPIAADRDGSQLGDSMYLSCSGLPAAILVPYLNWPVLGRLEIGEVSKGGQPHPETKRLLDHVPIVYTGCHNTD